jgi:tetratricopeptide (TPR) repeat protein
MALDSTALLQNAIALGRAGRHQEALSAYDEILRHWPEFPDALNNRGVSLAQLQRYDEALASFDRAVAVRVNFPEALRNRGAAFEGKDELDSALESYQRALEVKPDFLDVLFDRHRLFVRLGRHEEALASLDRILQIDSRHSAALYERALALFRLKRYEEARAAFERAFEVSPASIPVMNDFGAVLLNLRRYSESLAWFDRTLALDAKSPEALNNRGLALLKLLRYQDALDSFDAALEIKPDFATAHHNRGVALEKLGRHDSALECQMEAIKFQPDLAEAHLHRGLMLLRLGHFEKGLREYEWRWLSAGGGGARRVFSQPLWIGRENLRGKSIFIHAEQGFGDTIQFARFVPVLAALGARISIAVPPILAPLIRTLKGVEHMVALGDPPPRTDFHCPLLSLPLALGTTLATIPSEIPYLQVDSKRAKALGAEIASRARVKATRLIGVCWSGNPSHGDDHERSIAFEAFATVVAGSGATFVSLQKDVRATDSAALKKSKLVDLSSELKDFSDTAAAVSLMDLVISVDTSVAHLAGALGKPVWILLPQSADWRWLIARDDSPWYPSAKLHRQAKAGEWQPLIRSVKRELAKLLEMPRKIEV